MSKIWCDLRALFFQEGQPRTSHQILPIDFGKDAWAKSGAQITPDFALWGWEESVGQNLMQSALRASLSFRQGQPRRWHQI